MVCARCITAVSEILQQMHLPVQHVQLGEVVLQEEPTTVQRYQLSERLQEIGFELLDDAKKQLIDKVKTIVIEQIHHKGDEKFPFPEILAKALNKEYSVISKLFSETEGVTIEQYVILQKIEKAKELLAYNEMTLNDISFQLGYSSSAHLSAQFKKVTGLTPSQFKALGIHLRKPIDRI